MTIWAHMTTQHVLAPAESAFAFLADPIKLGRWSLGCFDSGPAAAPDLYTGLSLFDGGRGWYRIEADAGASSIDFLIGAPDRLVRRISARIMAGAPLDYPADSCLVTLTAWRPAAMADERWRRLCASHETEIWLIKSQIETERQKGLTEKSR